VAVSRVALNSGLSLSYCEEGDGVPLVQVHGLGTGRRNFDLIRPHLARRLHVYDLDLPGYGESDPQEQPRSIDEFAEDVAEFIEALGLAPAHVHGGSMGGMIALALAARHPEARRPAGDHLHVRPADNSARMMYRTWRTAASRGRRRWPS